MLILKKIYWRLKKILSIVKYYFNKTKSINTIKANIINELVFLTNVYPSYNNIYRNMFVHSRVKEYSNKGLSGNVIVVNHFKSFYLREFEGINVAEIDSSILKEAVQDCKGLKFCAHFLDRSIWDGVKDSLANNMLVVWIHGAEIQPWWRRKFNIKNDKELEKEKANTLKRMELWDEVFNHPNIDNIHFVFVSEYFKNEVCEDYKLKLNTNQYTIIHNYINTTKFNYVKKPVEQRKKILTIKPFASNKYGNDITQKAILELSKNPIFSDLEFAIYGDGEYFERDTAGLEKFPNVKLNKGFLLQDDIAKIHKDYGVYIATTRMDAQGVSRDEAMSSGLVPIANAVAAIPEFVDDNCGILVDGEDYMGVANSVIKLYNDPELFEKLSQGAANRVRNQSAFEHTIGKEIELIKNI